MERIKKMAAAFLALGMTATLCFCDAASAGEPDTEDGESSYYLDYESKYDPSQPVYVIGHLSPDADTVCSAIGYADFLKQLGYDAVPAISGAPNAETEFVLERFGVETPEILENADGRQFILVDHSSYGQSIPGMERANVLGILDHHGVGDVLTEGPIMYVGMPVGSTATIVYTLYQDYDVTISKEMAGLMLSAILSDTKGLRSSTTTDYDSEAAEELSALAGVDDISAYTIEMVNAGNTLNSMTAEEILKYDYKEYTSGSVLFSIAVVQSADDAQLGEIEKALNAYMGESFDSLGVSRCYVMLTNRITLETKLLCYGEDALAAAQEAFGTEEDEILLENTSSRKKQVAPALMEALKDKGKE